MPPESYDDTRNPKSGRPNLAPPSDQGHKRRSKTIRSVSLGIALLTLLGGATHWALGVLNEAEAAAVRAYLGSVCSAVEDYRNQRGRYPSDLNEINASTLDYNVGIPLAALAYEIDGAEITVSYTTPHGDSFSCTRTRTALVD